MATYYMYVEQLPPYCFWMEYTRISWRSSLICHSNMYFKKSLHKKQNLGQKGME